MANEITILEDGTIFCDGILCVLKSLYVNCDECGDCPIVKIHEELKSIDFDIYGKRISFGETDPEEG